MRKTIIIIYIFLSLIFVSILGNLNMSYASEETPDSLLSKGDDFISQGQSEGDKLMPDSKLKEIISPIANVFVTVATLIIVCTTLVMGIKYVTSGPEQQATLKKQLVGLAVSIVVIYGSYGIWLLAYQIMSSF